MQDTGPGNGKNAGWYEAEMPGSLSTAAAWPVAWVSGSLDGHLDGAWVSGSVYLEKVPAFFDFAGTFFDAKPIETH